jgi:hypothetical protein
LSRELVPFWRIHFIDEKLEVNQQLIGVGIEFPTVCEYLPKAVFPGSLGIKGRYSIHDFGLSNEVDFKVSKNGKHLVGEPKGFNYKKIWKLSH